MKFKYRSKISFTSLFLNLVAITGFFYLILNSDKFESFSSYSKVQAYGSNLNVLKEDVSDSSTINVNNIYIDNNLNWVIYYIVQRWDILSNIALNFWITVSHIKKVNKLKSDIIKPWQRLTITDEEWFIYISKWETASEIAKKYKINKEDILVSNSLNVDDYIFDKWDEVFIPMSEEEYKKLFKTQKSKQTTYITSISKTTSKLSYKGKNIIYKRWYNPNVTNWFYRWQCTRYVAIKKFPYITKNKQRKLWNGNAKYWYTHAKTAWYHVWKTPKIGSIVVIRVWWRHYYYAWHVGIVKQIDWKHKRLLIEEMNAIGKFIVTKRWIYMNNNIIWYIYI